MNLPNLFNIAAGVIGGQDIELFSFVERKLGAGGRYENIYSAGKTIFGNFQPVSAARALSMGLDGQKNYFVLYTSEVVRGADEERGADYILFGGSRYDALEMSSEWMKLNGWNGSLFVEVK